MAFGSGGGLLQKLNRDTQKCAFKCAMAVVDGEEREVFKDPITDPGKWLGSLLPRLPSAFYYFMLPLVSPARL